jgi:CBS domain-containing protein
VLVSDVMTAFPAYIRLGATIRRAAEMVSVSEVGQLMVLDHDSRFVGSLSEEDLVRAMLPSFEDVTAAGGTLADAFRTFLERGRTLADRVIDPLVVRDAATGHPQASGGRRRFARRHAVPGRSLPCGDLPFLNFG